MFDTDSFGHYFEAGLIGSVTGIATDLALADVDGDAHVDLVVAQSSGPTVLLGTGSPLDGAFECLSAVPADHGATTLALGDFDGNGIADIAFTDGATLSVVGHPDG